MSSTTSTTSTTYTTKLTTASILILGGTSGIGLAVAAATLAQQPHPTGDSFHLTICGSNPTRLASALSTLRASFPAHTTHISGHACDLSSATSLEPNLRGLLDAVTNNGARKIDHLVYTAGDALPLTPLADLDVAAIHAAGTVRFLGPLVLAKLLPAYVAPGPASSLTLTGGVNTHRPAPGWTVPAAYGAAMGGMMRGLAVDLAPLRVNLVEPGAVETGLWASVPGGQEGREALKRRFAERTTVGGIGGAEDVAEAYVYLMRDRFAAGSVVASNGGTLLK